MRIKYLLLLGLLFVFSDCQKDEQVAKDVQIDNSDITVRQVSAEEVPHVIKFLNSQVAEIEVQSLKGLKFKLPFNKNRIIKEKINEVHTYEGDVTTYTFAVKKKKKEPWVSNLIVTEKSNGSYKQIILLRYLFDDDFNNAFNTNEVSLNDFEGQVEQFYVYEENKNDEKGFYDLEPCETYDPGNPIGGDPNDPYNPDNPSGGSGPGTNPSDPGGCQWVPCGCPDEEGVIITWTFECGTSAQNLLGDCPDPDPIAPNDPGYIDLNDSNAEFACNIFDLPLNECSEDSPVRLATTAYRFGKRAYKIYKKTGKLTVKKLKDAGLDEIADIADQINTVFGASSSGWERVLAFLELVSGIDLPDSKAIKWAKDSNNTFGSYEISWWDGVKRKFWYYVGKGTDKREAISKGKETGGGAICIKCDPTWRPADIVDGIDRNGEDAAFKEEMVKMWSKGWDPTLPTNQRNPGDMLNKINSPGYNKINTDGF